MVFCSVKPDSIFRQELHERIRELSMEAGKTVKVEGKDNNLLELIAADPAFNLSLEDLQRSMDPKKYIGRAKEQTERFVNTVVQPILDSHKELLGAPPRRKRRLRTACSRQS